MAKHINLPPWLDYFVMRVSYEQNGLLEIQGEKHEAYVTRAALHAMTPGDDPVAQLYTGAVADTARRDRCYRISAEAFIFIPASEAVTVL